MPLRPSRQVADLPAIAAEQINSTGRLCAYTGWDQSEGDLGMGAAGTAQGNRLPFTPVLQQPGTVPFRLKGR